MRNRILLTFMVFVCLVIVAIFATYFTTNYHCIASHTVHTYRQEGYGIVPISYNVCDRWGY